MEPTITLPWSFFTEKILFIEPAPVVILCEELKLELEPLEPDENCWTFDITQDLRIFIEPHEDAPCGLLCYTEKDGGEYHFTDLYRIIRNFYKLGIGHLQQVSFGDTPEGGTYIKFE